VNPTAGILAGDRLELAVRVGTGASLLAMNRRRPRVYDAVWSGRMQADVRSGSGGWLEYEPEPLCPHAGCDYRQSTRIEVAENGEACWVDTLAPGAVGRDEIFAWRRLASRSMFFTPASRCCANASTMRG